MIYEIINCSFQIQYTHLSTVTINILFEKQKSSWCELSTLILYLRIGLVTSWYCKGWIIKSILIIKTNKTTEWLKPNSKNRLIRYNVDYYDLLQYLWTWLSSSYNFVWIIIYCKDVS